MIWKWIAGAVLLTSLVLIVVFREGLISDQEPLSTTVRNLALVVAAIVALPLAIWRSTVAEGQANTARQGLLNERYQKGAEMLASEITPVRLAGIYALASLARDHPEQYHIQIIELLCAFVRNPSEIKEDQGVPSSEDSPLREDVQAAITAVGNRGNRGLGYEKARNFQLDLNHAFLKQARLRNANLSGADLMCANLSHADLRCADLSGADLEGTDLAMASLSGLDLSGAKIGTAVIELSTDVLAIDTILTQTQLDRAKANPDNPPAIDSFARDAVTGKPLLWLER